MSNPNLPPPPGGDDQQPSGETPLPPPPGNPPPPADPTPPPPAAPPPPPPGQPPAGPPPSAPPPAAPPGAPPQPGGGFVGAAPQQPYQQSSGGSGVGEAFQYGWTKFQQNFGQLVIAILVWIVALIVASAVFWGLLFVFGAVGTSTNEFGVEEPNSLGVIGIMLTMGLGSLFVLAANFIGGAALLRVGLLTTKGDEVTPQKLFSTDNLVPYVLTSLIVAVVIFVVSFISCGILWVVPAFFLFFAPFYSLDQGTSPVEALRASVTLVNRNIATVIVLFIGSTIAFAIGLALCGIGVLVAYPVVLIAYGYMYRQLNGEPIAA